MLETQANLFLIGIGALIITVLLLCFWIPGKIDFTFPALFGFFSMWSLCFSFEPNGYATFLGLILTIAIAAYADMDIPKSWVILGAMAFYSITLGLACSTNAIGLW